MSFADGFKQGFGMMGAVQDRELYKQRLDEQARQSDLDREATAAYRKAQTDNAAEQTRIRGLEADNKKTQLGLDKTRIDADANLRTAQAGAINDELELKKTRRGQRETNSAAALQVQSFVDLA